MRARTALSPGPNRPKLSELQAMSRLAADRPHDITEPSFAAGPASTDRSTAQQSKAAQPAAEVAFPELGRGG